MCATLVCTPARHAKLSRLFDTCACVHACVLSRVQYFVTPMDCSMPGSFVYGILQARILGWVAISSPGGYS